MKKTIKLTLEETESYEEYCDLRDEMVEDLVLIEMDAPTQWSAEDHERACGEARYRAWLEHRPTYLEDVFRCLFDFMTDEDLQDRHGEHIEYFEEEDIN